MLSDIPLNESDLICRLMLTKNTKYESAGNEIARTPLLQKWHHAFSTAAVHRLIEPISSKTDVFQTSGVFLVHDMH